MRKTFLNISLLPLLLLSCGRNNVAVEAPVRYVTETINDTSRYSHKVLADFNDADNGGTISIIGPSRETAILTEIFLTCDRFDNIDGKDMPDGLPDFAGETFAPMFDVANEPYRGYFDAMNENFFREMTVKCAVASVSSACCSSPFDHLFSEPKAKSKLIILSSSYMSGFGYNDIADCFAGFGKRVGIIAPVQSAVGHVLDRHPEAGMVGVWADIDVIASGVYGSYFQSEIQRRELKDASCVCLSPSFTGDAAKDLVSFLDMYIASEHDEPLSAVIIDDLVYASCADSLNVEARKLAASEDEENVAYRNVMGDGFEFISTRRAMAEECYRYLREGNRFTHKIAYPSVDGFMTVAASDLQFIHLDGNGMMPDDFKFNRASGSDVETVKVIRANHRYFPEGCLEQLDSIAPLTIKSLFYVYQ